MPVGCVSAFNLRRSPHGERGLKQMQPWVRYQGMQGRSPHGERGLKPASGAIDGIVLRRSPHGERGLKQPKESFGRESRQSLPSRGAWIETTSKRNAQPGGSVAPLTGSVD